MSGHALKNEEEIGCYQVSEQPVLSPRVQRLRNSFNNVEVKTSVQRAKIVLEVYKEAGAESTIITRAKVLDRYLREMTLYIDENPIVGGLTQYRRGVNPSPEYDTTATKMLSIFGELAVSAEEKEALVRVDNFFKGKTQLDRVTDAFCDLTGQDRGEFRATGLWLDIVGFPLGFVDPPYEKLMKNGLKSLIQEVEQKLAELNLGNYEEFKKRDFYKAVIMTLKAVIAWANRYADLAEKMAKDETDSERKSSLELIAETCRQVPENPPRSFYEAIQFFWFIHAACWIEQSSAAIVPGRFPQYMYPFYRKDKEAGKITEEETLELLELLCIKLSEIGVQLSSAALLKGGQQHTAQSFVIGGFTPDGRDATNEIDFLWLEAEKRVRMIQPSTVAVLHNKMSEDFLMKCADTIKMGLGKPALINGDIAVQRNLNRWKCSMEEAYDFTVFGCSQSFPRHSLDGAWGGLLNIAKVLSVTLNNGVDPKTGKQMGLQTGDAANFKSYDELYDAFLKQLRYFVGLIRKVTLISDNVHATYYPTPLASAFTDDCIKLGKDRYNGGAKYGGDLDCSAGVVDTANSLYAIKKLVFEDRKTTLEEMNEAIKANFEGHEDLRKLLWTAPKYGNQDERVDSIVRAIYDEFCNEELSYKTRLGNDDGRPYAIVVSGHGYFGENTGAQPCGRVCGSLTDGSVSATPGSDLNGPTALASSAAGSIDMRKYSGNIFNMKFHPSALSTDDDKRKMLSLIRTYMDMGGYHIQFNVASAKLLKEAKSCPEQYKDLVVRVAGYSVYFVNIDSDIQDEIIARTEYNWR